MSETYAAFRRALMGDAVDSVDTVEPAEAATPHSVHRVNSVTVGNAAETPLVREGGRAPPDPADAVLAHVAALAPVVAEALGADDVIEDRAAIAEAGEISMPPDPGEPPEALVDRLARAGADLPWQRATSPAGLDYLRREARARLARLDPLSRGLLVADAETTARRFERKL